MKKRAIVTGASNGIGRAISRQLAEEGWQVLAVARRTELLETLGKEWPQNIVPYTADVTEPGQHKK